MIKVRINRWRVRFQLRLPGPLVLTRGTAGKATRSGRCAHRGVTSSQRGASGTAGWFALFILGYAGLQARRHRRKRSARTARWIPAWKISLVLVGIIVVLVILV